MMMMSLKVKKVKGVRPACVLLLICAWTESQTYRALPNIWDHSTGEGALS